MPGAHDKEPSGSFFFRGETPHGWLLSVDGSAVPNPGLMGAGVVLHAPDGRVFERAIALPGRGCNNEAETHALLAGLQLARECEVTVITVRTDSSVLIEQLSRPPERPLARLEHLLNQARASLLAFDDVTWQWIPRHRNAQADALARQALGMPARAPAPHPGLKRRPRRKT